MSRRTVVISNRCKLDLKLGYIVIRAEVWTVIVAEKILKQMKLLEKAGLIQAASRLRGYIEEIELNDESNREGHSANMKRML